MARPPAVEAVVRAVDGVQSSGTRSSPHAIARRIPLGVSMPLGPLPSPLGTRAAGPPGCRKSTQQSRTLDLARRPTRACVRARYQTGLRKDLDDAAAPRYSLVCGRCAAISGGKRQHRDLKRPSASPSSKGPATLNAHPGHIDQAGFLVAFDVPQAEKRRRANRHRGPSCQSLTRAPRKEPEIPALLWSHLQSRTNQFSL